MNNRFLVLIIVLTVLLFSFIPTSASETSFTKGTVYGDAVFELEEKLAIWENREEDADVRELEMLRDLFSGLSGSTAPYSKGFKMYIDVLIDIVRDDFNPSIKSTLRQIKMNGDFCEHLEEIHKQYVHIGTVVQIENYMLGRESEYLYKEAKDEQEQLDYFQTAISCYERCNGWLDSAMRCEGLKIITAELLYDIADDLMDRGEYFKAYIYFDRSQSYGKNCKRKLDRLEEKIGYVPLSADDVLTAPSNLKVEDKSPNTVILSWNSVTHAVKYEIFYREEGKTGWSSMEIENTRTSIEISPLKPGVYYEYKVAAFSGELKKESNSIIVEKPGIELHAGDIVEFGKYYKTDNRKEPIEWIVLSVDTDQDTAMMISKYILACMQWNTENIKVSWHDCTVRTWLNSEFYDNSFSAAEKTAIVPQRVSNSTDNVFLLNADEARKYLGENNGSVLGAIPTVFVRNNLTTGLWYDTGTATSSWWLRNDSSVYTDVYPRYGWKGYCADVVTTRHSIQNDIITTIGYWNGDAAGEGVRPVIVVSLMELSSIGILQ